MFHKINCFHRLLELTSASESDVEPYLGKQKPKIGLQNKISTLQPRIYYKKIKGTSSSFFKIQTRPFFVNGNKNVLPRQLFMNVSGLHDDPGQDGNGKQLEKAGQSGDLKFYRFVS